MTFVNLYLYL